ncbi:MAG TPA: Calx-beta domain-containing protein [Thermoanaerobaculia bacterium]|nr:Calx-beta domain-containing protein [Thermoanaerobaculia bacterium]
MKTRTHILALFFAVPAAFAGSKPIDHAAVAAQSLTVVGGTWVSQGPSPINNGQSEGMTNRPQMGAIEAIAPHPTNADIIWIGAVNGGIWKTTNGTAASPTWTPVGDALASMSIGALALDPTDATSNTLVAGVNRYSSFASFGGPYAGLFRSTNGGSNWTPLDANMSVRGISAVLPRGATIVAAVQNATSFSCANLGIWRSTDSGATFTKITNGIPAGQVFDLVGDPSNNAVMYASIKFGSDCSSGAMTNGIYKSIDTGASWAKVSDGAMDALLTNALQTNVRMAVGLSGQVYVGIVNGGQIAGLFRSGTGGSSWTPLDLPSTVDSGVSHGLQPDAEHEDGGQGATHFSIVADPTNANIVYVGGDRQPDSGNPSVPFPNSVGANTYSGRLFRINAAAGAGAQASSLTHCTTNTAACGNAASTASNSSPHADSRRLVFDANGNILESDDGGIYRRTNPRTVGDWSSVLGTLCVTEQHDIAYDTVSNMIMSGNQDNGTSEQSAAGGTTWRLAQGGDGGDVAIDDISSATQSIRFCSSQNLGGFTRRTMNASGVLTAVAGPLLTLTGGSAFSPQFVTPVELNVIDPTRLLFAGSNDLYESLDRGDTIAGLGLNKKIVAMAYGGRSGGVDTAAVIYAISSEGSPASSFVYVRSSGSGAPVATATTPSTTLRDVAIDPTNWQNAYVVDASGQVFSTPNAGGTWTNITGNLAGGTTSLYSIVYIPGSPSAIVVGGEKGVFRMALNAVGTWFQFGSGLSNAPVHDLDFDVTDDTLIAGTMGRGAWSLTPASTTAPLPVLTIGDVSVAEGNSGTVPANFTVTLTPASAGTVTVNYATADNTATQVVSNLANASPFTINSSGAASTYPSNIIASGLTGTVTKVTATLNGYSHTYPSDVDVLLVGPGGQTVVLMSDVAPGDDAVNVNLTFDDAASGPMPSSVPVTGTYQPTNISDGEGDDVYPAPAPQTSYGSALSVFNGTVPNGTWSLYVRDDFAGDSGSMAGGWSLTISTTGGDYAVTSGQVTFAPGATTQTITVNVNGDATNEPDETFFVNLTNPSGATIGDAQAIGTITNDDGTVLPPTNVVATAASATSVNLTWTAAAGAASYRVYRSSNHIGYSLVGSPAGTNFTDATAVAGTAYLYKVRSFSGSESVDSNVSLATAIVYTDSVLTSTNVKLVHFTQLLTAVNAVRTLAGLSAIAFTAPTPATNITLRAQHVLDLRAGLTSAWPILGITAPVYTDSSLTAGSTAVKKLHVTELRDAMN